MPFTKEWYYPLTKMNWCAIDFFFNFFGWFIKIKAVKNNSTIKSCKKGKPNMHA